MKIPVSFSKVQVIRSTVSPGWYTVQLLVETESKQTIIYFEDEYMNPIEAAQAGVRALAELMQ